MNINNTELVYVYVPRTNGILIRTFDDVLKYYRTKKLDAYIQCRTAIPPDRVVGWDCYVFRMSV